MTGVIENAGYQAKLADASAKEWAVPEVRNDIDAFDLHIVVIESNFASVKHDIDIIGQLMREGDFLSVLVGPPASQFNEAILQDDHVDVVGRYEYDLAIRDIAAATEDGTDLGEVPGISYRRDGRIVQTADRPFMTPGQLDAIPFVTSVSKNHLGISNLLSQTLDLIVKVFAARLRPEQCAFCS